MQLNSLRIRDIRRESPFSTKSEHNEYAVPVVGVQPAGNWQQLCGQKEGAEAPVITYNNSTVPHLIFQHRHLSQKMTFSLYSY